MKTIKKYSIPEIFNIIKSLHKASKNKNWTSMPPFEGKLAISDWHSLCLSNGMSTNVRYNLYVQLDENIEKIKKLFRKSYKPLIGVAEKSWNTEIHKKNITIDIWNDFKSLHCEVSGRVTRSDETWDIQYENIKADKAFFISLTNDSLEMVGGAFLNLLKMKVDIKLLLMIEIYLINLLAILFNTRPSKNLKGGKLNFISLDLKVHESDNPKPSEKEISISYFKEGFASLSVPEYVLEQT